MNITRITNIIDELKSEWKCDNDALYFRGHSQHSYRLIPSIYRNVNPGPRGNRSVPYYEGVYYAEALIYGTEYFDQSNKDWEMISMMQHYGIPTRMLDWTDSLLVAMYFALFDRVDPDRPHIWVHNPFKANVQTSQRKIEDSIVTIGMDEIFSYTDAFLKGRCNAGDFFEHSVFIEVPWKNPRIRSQRGFFTVFVENDHNKVIPLDEYSKTEEFCRRIDIQPEEIPDIKKLLSLGRVNQFSIFSDLESLGRHIVNKYKHATP